jgi:hypothetical protein
MRTFVNNGSRTVGFSRAGPTGSDLLDGPTTAVFGSWDMLSSIGPISGPGILIQWNWPAVLTSGGTLYFYDNDLGNMSTTFTATITPEPSSLALLGLAAVLGLASRRSRKTL